ncbi:MAG: hypothetical protein JRM78_04210 [Nitrososphaerota archaeon]|jgi:hypothetical protein|nr:hypothetical protein [Nitrososphaerota archaeon]
MIESFMQKIRSLATALALPFRRSAHEDQPPTDIEGLSNALTVEIDGQFLRSERSAPGARSADRSQTGNKDEAEKD